MIAIRQPVLLSITFAIVWVCLAIHPVYRFNWLLENVLVFIGLPMLYVAHRRKPFSPVSSNLLFVFLVLHQIGAHYTYAEVPYDRWFRSLTGHELNPLLGFERNHFDRLVHFLCGLLLFLPTRELLARSPDLRRSWTTIVAVLILVVCSTTFELLEWLAALVFGGDLGMAYLGTQGDVWDAHKDTALASAGAVIAALTLGRTCDR